MDVMTDDPHVQAAVDRIVAAWLVPGRMPAVHDALKRQLHREWPVLARAVEDLVEARRRQ